MHFAIIAAGEGSRLVQEGVQLPKPLVRLAGEPMIDRLINIFLRCGAESLSIIVNEQMTAVREHLEALELPVPLHLVRCTHIYYRGDAVFKELFPVLFCHIRRYIAAPYPVREMSSIP